MIGTPVVEATVRETVPPHNLARRTGRVEGRVRTAGLSPRPSRASDRQPRGSIEGVFSARAPGVRKVDLQTPSNRWKRIGPRRLQRTSPTANHCEPHGGLPASCSAWAVDSFRDITHPRPHLAGRPFSQRTALTGPTDSRPALTRANLGSGHALTPRKTGDRSAPESGGPRASCRRPER